MENGKFENEIKKNDIQKNTKNTKLKICGIRDISEINELKDLDIDYFGCIFAKSQRQVDSELAAKITKTAHKYGKKTVGVFVNAIIENIIKIIDETDIDVIQLHGEESAEYCAELSKKLERLHKKNNYKKRKNFSEKTELWKVFSVKDEFPDISEYVPFIQYPLFDAKGENRGGNGIVFDWEILKNLKNYSFVLAGGLSRENIEKALEYNPAILDLNSKVEIDGKKNKYLIEKVIQVVKGNK